MPSRTIEESLRDIETWLRAVEPKLYPASIRGKVSRSTLADANETRDGRIYADFARVLIAIARKLYAQDDFGVALQQTAYALDSTIIDLCLSLFPRARFRKRKGAVKVHTRMDLRGSIPCLIRITAGKMHDVNILDELLLEPGAFYVMDRGYIDFGRLYAFGQSSACFVVRAKSTLDYSRRAYRRVDKSTGLRSDQTIILKGPKTSQGYPDPLRRISYFDTDTQKRFVFLTHNFTLAPLTIAQLSKCRWRVELFFKWIKQYLRIKAFYGTSENAVKTQIWIAITLFEKVYIYQALTSLDLQNKTSASCNQLTLFDF